MVVAYAVHIGPFVHPVTGRKCPNTDALVGVEPGATKLTAILAVCNRYPHLFEADVDIVPGEPMEVERWMVDWFVDGAE